jgi:hypothetical protein
VLISTHFVIGIHLPSIVSDPKNTHDYIPCNGENINTF